MAERRKKILIFVAATCVQTTSLTGEPAVMLTLFPLMPDGEGRDRGDGDPLYIGVPRGTGACSWSSLSCSNPGWREDKALTATEKDKESYLRTPAFILELV
jgi:hypothetical protein